MDSDWGDQKERNSMWFCEIFFLSTRLKFLGKHLFVHSSFEVWLLQKKRTLKSNYLESLLFLSFFGKNVSKILQNFWSICGSFLQIGKFYNYRGFLPRSFYLGRLHFKWIVFCCCFHSIKIPFVQLWQIFII